MKLFVYEKSKIICAGILSAAILSSALVDYRFLDNLHPSVISKNVAMAIAQDEVLQNCDLAQKDLWTKTSVVTNAFPIEIDGIEGTSYYECKVQTEGKPAGYVLVNTNKTDGLIVESAPDGITLTEQYQKDLGRKDFAVKRYNWIKSVAMDNNSKVLSSKGFDVKAESITAYITNFRNTAAKKGCTVALSKASVKDYYKDITISSNIQTVNAADWRDDYAELKNTLNNGWHTPQYTQFAKNDGYPIGCGPTAWSIVYGYWAAFKDKNNLFDGLGRWFNKEVDLC